MNRWLEELDNIGASASVGELLTHWSKCPSSYAAEREFLMRNIASRLGTQADFEMALQRSNRRDTDSDMGQSAAR